MAEVLRVTFVRSGGEHHHVFRVIGEHLAEAVALSLMLSVASAHAVCLVDDYEVPL